jgi:hypothetical protein
MMDTQSSNVTKESRRCLVLMRFELGIYLARGLGNSNSTCSNRMYIIPIVWEETMI